MFNSDAIYIWAGQWATVMLDATIKGAILLTLAFLAAPILRKRSAAVRQLLWLMVLGVLLVLPLVSQALPGWRVLPSWAKLETPAPVVSPSLELPPAAPFELPAEIPAQPIETYSIEAPVIAESPIEAPPLAPVAPVAPQIAAVPEVRPDQVELPSPPVRPVPWLAFIWSVGFLVCLAPLLLGRISLWRLARSSRRPDDSWDELACRAAHALSLRRGVTILMSDRETMPMVWGAFRPKLLLPAEAKNWSADRRWVVLLHELAHAKRRDCLAKLVAHLASAVYWFNPLCWMAFKRMQREAETACDDLVLGAGHKPTDYAQHLLEIASGLKSGMLAAYSSIAMARPSEIEGRLLSILDSKRNRRRITAWGLLAAVVLTTAIAIPLSIMRAATKEDTPAADKAAEESPTTQPTEKEMTQARAEVARVFDRAVKEHTQAVGELAALKPGVGVLYKQSMGFKHWGLGPYSGGRPALNRSAAMEDLTAKCLAAREKGLASRARACVEAAGKYLAHKNAAYRTVACEFLVWFPQYAVESGLTPAVGALLGDRAAAFEGASFSEGQRDTYITRIDGGVRVSDVARLALVRMTTFHFDNLEAFRAWWPRNKEYRRRLWYWSLRWRHVRPGRERAALADLDDFRPGEALRMLLLACNNGAKLADSGLPPAARAGSGLPWPVRERSLYCPQFSPKTIADFVRKHELKPALIRIVRQNPIWPEARGDDPMRGLFYTVLPVLPLVLDKSDAALVATEIKDPRGVLALARTQDILADLVKVTVRLDPKRAEGILVAQLKRKPHQPLIAAQLVRQTALKHWQMIQAACPESEDKQDVIRTLAELRTPQAAAALGQWLAAEDWTPKLNDYGYETDSGPQFLFGEFVKAAAALNGGKPVIAQDLLKRSRWRLSKAWTPEQTRAANKPVPAARAEAIVQLKKFLARAAAQPATRPARADLGRDSLKIEVNPRDSLPGGLYAVGPYYLLRRQASDARGLYVLRRANTIGDDYEQLVGRVPGYLYGLGLKGGNVLEVIELARVGNRIHGRLKYVRSPVGDRHPAHSVYLRAGLGKLPPGNYKVEITFEEYSRSNNPKDKSVPKGGKPPIPAMTCTFVVPDKPSSARASVATLLAEAEKLRKDQPKQWAGWDEAVAHVLAERAARVKNWVRHVPPPRADVAPLKLPLAYLVWHWREVSTAQHLPPVSPLADMHLLAIGDSADERRIDVLLRVLGSGKRGGDLLAKAMTAERVEASIRELLAGAPKLGRYAPLHLLLREFAAILSPEVRKVGYDWLRSNWPQGPSNGEGEKYWETLFRLDLDRARREVIPYYGQRYGRDRHDMYVLLALLAHAGPSEQVANAVRQWRKTPDKFLDPFRRRILVCADPGAELEGYVADIEAQFKSGQRPDELPYMVGTLVEHIPRQSVKYLRQFANDRRLTGLMGEGVRKRIIGWLVEQKDEQAEKIVARWLAEEDQYAQGHLIDILARQGEFARGLLRKIRPDIKLPPLPTTAPAGRHSAPAPKPADGSTQRPRVTPNKDRPTSLRQITIFLDSIRMRRMNLTVSEILGALPSSGSIEGDDVSKINRCVVVTRDGNAVPLKNIAEIRLGRSAESPRPSRDAPVTRITPKGIIEIIFQIVETTAKPATQPAVQAPPDILTAWDARVTGQKRIFVGKVVKIDWGGNKAMAALNAGKDHGYGSATFECTIPIRGLKKGERVVLPVLKVTFPVSSHDISPGIMDSMLFYEANIQVNSQWLVFVGMTHPEFMATTEKIGGLAHCPDGDESIIAETRKAVEIDDLPVAKKHQAMASVLRSLKPNQTQVLLPYICRTIVKIKDRRLETADLLNIRLADPAVEPPIKKRGNPNFRRKTAQYQLIVAMGRLRELALFHQPDEKPQTDVAQKVSRLLLKDARAMARQHVEIKYLYANYLIEAMRGFGEGWPEGLDISDGRGILKALEEIAADQEVMKRLESSTTAYTIAGVSASGNNRYFFMKTLAATRKAIQPTTQPAVKLSADDIARLQQMQRYLDFPEWKGPLCVGLKVRAQGDTWDELTAKVKPSFTWGQAFRSPNLIPCGFPDMMWVEDGADGKPIFRLARAFVWKPAGRKARWVLVDQVEMTSDESDRLSPEQKSLSREQTNGRALPVRLEVVKQKPSGKYFESYAIIKGSNSGGGTVYEIGWASEMSGGTGHYQGRSLLYVWRDAAGKWTLIGQAPQETHGKAGYSEGVECSFESMVRWRGRQPIPVISFVMRDTRYELGEDQVGLPKITICRDAVLDAAADSLPTICKWSDQDYLVAEKGDTLEKIVHRLVCWGDDWKSGGEKTNAGLLKTREKLRQARRKKLLQLNPKLASFGAGSIPEGTRVIILERASAQPATQPAKVDLGRNSLKIETAPQDILPGGLYVIGPYQPLKGSWPPTAHALYVLRRDNKIGDGCDQLIGRLPKYLYGFGAKGGSVLEVLEFTRVGNRILGRFKYMRPLLGAKFAGNSAYLRAVLPKLPPGEYQVELSFKEYYRIRDGKDSAAAKDAKPPIPAMTCKFVVPGKAAAKTAGTASDPTAARAKDVDAHNRPKRIVTEQPAKLGTGGQELDPNSFQALNPNFKKRAGGYYEKEYLPKAVDQLARAAELTDRQKDFAKQTLRQFIYDYLDSYVRGQGKISANARRTHLAAMDERFIPKLSKEQHALYIRWRSDTTGAKNTLAFIMIDYGAPRVANRLVSAKIGLENMTAADKALASTDQPATQPATQPASQPADLRPDMREILRRIDRKEATRTTPRPEAAKRAAHAQRLAGLGDPQAVPLLIAVLNDRDIVRGLPMHFSGVPGRPEGGVRWSKWDTNASIRTEAAIALGRLASPAAVEPLIATLGDRSLRLRIVSMQALGQIGDTRAIEPLRKMLSATDGRDAGAAVKALAAIGGPKAVEAIAQLLKSPHRVNRGNAIAALGEEGGAEAVKALEAAALSEDHTIRDNAKDALVVVRRRRAFQEATRTDAQLASVLDVRVLPSGGYVFGGGQYKNPDELLVALKQSAGEDRPPVRIATDLLSYWRGTIDLLNLLAKADFEKVAIVKSTPAPPAPAPRRAATTQPATDSVTSVAEAFGRIHKRVVALKVQYPVLKGIATVKPQFGGDNAFTRREARWNFANNASEWGKGAEPSAVDASKPFCRIIFNMWMWTGSKTGQPVDTQRSYQVGGVAWEGYLKVWSDDAKLVKAVKGIVDDELARITARPATTSKPATQPAAKLSCNFTKALVVAIRAKGDWKRWIVTAPKDIDRLVGFFPGVDALKPSVWVLIKDKNVVLTRSDGQNVMLALSGDWRNWDAGLDVKTGKPTIRPVRGDLKAFLDKLEKRPPAPPKAAPPAVVDALFKQLSSKDYKVRGPASKKLGEIADRQVVERLGKIVADGAAGYSYRCAAVNALGYVRGHTLQVMPILVGAVGARGLAGKGVFEALTMQAVNDKTALPFIIQAVRLKGSRVEIQWRCDHIIWKDIGPVAIPFLLKAINDPGCRDWVTSALHELAPDAAAATDELIISLDASSRYTQRTAALALAGIGLPAPKAISALLRMLNDKKGSVAPAAAEALGVVAPRSLQVVKALTTALGRQEAEVRYSAARALGRIGPSAASALDPLTVLLKDKSVYVRTFSVEAIGRLGPKARKAAPMLAGLLTNKNIDVRCAASLAIWRVMGYAGPALNTLASDLRAKDGWGRQRAAETLGEIGPSAAKAVPALIKVLSAIPEGHARYNFGQDREAAANALGRIGQAAQSALPALIKALSDPRDRVRKAAAKAIMMIDRADRLFSVDPEMAKVSLAELARGLRENEYEHGALWAPLKQFLAKTVDKPQLRAKLAGEILVRIEALRKKGKWSTCTGHGFLSTLIALKARGELLQLMANETSVNTCCGSDSLMLAIVAMGHTEDAWPILRHFAKSEAEGWSSYLNDCMIRLTGGKTIPPGAIRTKSDTDDKAFRNRAVQAWAKRLVTAKIGLGTMTAADKAMVSGKASAAVKEVELDKRRDAVFFFLGPEKDKLPSGLQIAPIEYGYVSLVDIYRNACKSSRLGWKLTSFVALVGRLPDVFQSTDRFEAVRYYRRGNRIVLTYRRAKPGPARGTAPWPVYVWASLPDNLKPGKYAAEIIGADPKEKLPRLACSFTVPDGPPTTQPTTQPARRKLSILNSILLVDKDDLPAGMHCRVSPYRTTDHPGAKWVYRHTLDAIKRGGAGPDVLVFRELSARLEGSYTAKGALEAAEQYIQGNTITIRLRYIAEDRDISKSPLVRVEGDKQFKSVYLWGYMPKNLRPGRYTVKLELDEYIRKDGKVSIAPKGKIRHHERLTGIFIVPPAVTKPTTRPATRPAFDAGAMARSRAVAIEAALPKGWSVRIERDTLIIRRDEKVRGIHNSPVAPAPYKIEWFPSIMVRLGPRVSMVQYSRMALANEAARRLRPNYSPYNRPNLLPHSLPTHRDGQASFWISGAYLDRRIEFESKDVAQECAGVYGAIKGLFGPYTSPYRLWGTTVNGLHVGLDVERPAAAPDGKIRLLFRMRNAGDKPVRLLRLSAQARSWGEHLPIEVKVGRDRMKYRGPVLEPPPPPGPEQYVQLKPGEIDSIEVMMNPAHWGVKDLSKAVATFVLTNEHRTVAPGAGASAVTGLWTGTVRSTRIPLAAESTTQPATPTARAAKRRPARPAKTVTQNVRRNDNDKQKKGSGLFFPLRGFAKKES